MPSFDDTVRELVDLADAKGTCDDALDDLVRSTTDRIASETNNKGFEGQIRFLLVHLGLTEDTVAVIKERLTTGDEPECPDCYTALDKEGKCPDCGKEYLVCPRCGHAADPADGQCICYAR